MPPCKSKAHTTEDALALSSRQRAQHQLWQGAVESSRQIKKDDRRQLVGGPTDFQTQRFCWKLPPQLRWQHWPRCVAPEVLGVKLACC